MTRRALEPALDCRVRDHAEIADEITAAFARKSAAGFGELYSDDVIVWHSTDQSCQDKAANLASVDGFFSMVGDVRYSSIVRTMTDNGFVQEHVITGTFADGRPLPPTPACLIVTIEHGLIVRLNEYIDPARMIAASSED